MGVKGQGGPPWRFQWVKAVSLGVACGSGGRAGSRLAMSVTLILLLELTIHREKLPFFYFLKDLGEMEANSPCHS